MAVSVNATPLSPTANSFVTVARADEILDVDLFYAALWTAVTDADTKARAVITATSILNRFAFAGLKSTEEQALEFPRYGVYDQSGWLADSGLIPPFVERATAFLAAELIKSGTTDPMAASSQDDIGSLAVSGGVSLTFRDRSQRLTGLKRFPAVMQELKTVLCLDGTTFVRG